MQRKRKKSINKFLLVGFLILLSGCNEEKEVKEDIEFKKDIKIQVDSKTNTCNFITSFNGKELNKSDNDGKYIYLVNNKIKCPKVNTKEVGVIKLEYLLNDSVYTTFASIKDLSAPDVSVDNDLITITEGDDLNILDFINAKDNIDNPNDIIISYEGKYKLNTPGEYSIKIKGVDSDGNVGYNTFTLKVLAKPKSKPIVPDKPYIKPNETTKPTVPTIPNKPPTTVEQFVKGYMFADGYNIITAPESCEADILASNSSMYCKKIQNELGEYIGMGLWIKY